MPYSRDRILQESGIGKSIRDARERLGKSQADFATTIGMDPASISHIEAGSDHKVSTLLRIASYLGLSLMLVEREAVGDVRKFLERLRERRL